MGAVPPADPGYAAGDAPPGEVSDGPETKNEHAIVTSTRHCVARACAKPLACMPAGTVPERKVGGAGEDEDEESFEHLARGRGRGVITLTTFLKTLTLENLSYSKYYWEPPCQSRPLDCVRLCDDLRSSNCNESYTRCVITGGGAQRRTDRWQEVVVAVDFSISHAWQERQSRACQTQRGRTSCDGPPELGRLKVLGPSTEYHATKGKGENDGVWLQVLRHVRFPLSG